MSEDALSVLICINRRDHFPKIIEDDELFRVPNSVRSAQRWFGHLDEDSLEKRKDFFHHTAWWLNKITGFGLVAAIVCTVAALNMDSTEYTNYIPVWYNRVVWLMRLFYFMLVSGGVGWLVSEHAYNKISVLFDETKMYDAELNQAIEQYNQRVLLWNQAVEDDRFHGQGLPRIPEELRGYGDDLARLGGILEEKLKFVRYMYKRTPASLPAADEEPLKVRMEELDAKAARLCEHLQETEGRVGSVMSSLAEIEDVQTEIDALQFGPERRAADREVNETTRRRPTTQTT